MLLRLERHYKQEQAARKAAEQELAALRQQLSSQQGEMEAQQSSVRQVGPGGAPAPPRGTCRAPSPAAPLRSAAGGSSAQLGAALRRQATPAACAARLHGAARGAHTTHRPPAPPPAQERDALEGMRQQFEGELQAARAEVAAAQEALESTEERVRASERLERAQLEADYMGAIGALQAGERRPAAGSRLPPARLCPVRLLLPGPAAPPPAPHRAIVPAPELHDCSRATAAAGC